MARLYARKKTPEAERMNTGSLSKTSAASPSQFANTGKRTAESSAEDEKSAKRQKSVDDKSHQINAGPSDESQASDKKPAKNQKIVRVANKPRTKQAGKKGTDSESKPSAGSKSTADRDSSPASLAEDEKPSKRQRTVRAMDKPKRRRTVRATDKPKSRPLPLIPLKNLQKGKVYVCGQGDSGQLGLGNLIPDDDEDEDLDDPSEIKLPKHSPVDAADSEVVQVAAGGMHSVALTEDGKVFTTGVNDEAALGRCTDAAIWEQERAAGAVPQDAYKWAAVEIPSDFGKIVAVSAGDSHSVALTERGAVWCWGLFRGNSGPYGFLPGQPYALKPVLVYKAHSAAEQVTAISSGADHVLGVRRDGSVISWGYGEQGQLGRLGTRLRNPEKSMLEPGVVPLFNIKGYRKRFKAASVSAGSFGSFVTSADGVTVAFGVNASGQLGLNIKGNSVDSNTVQMPTRVTSLEDMVKGKDEKVDCIAAGKSHTLAQTSAGNVFSFGLQTYGRLGRADADPSSDQSLPPGQVEVKDDDSSATHIAAGHDTSSLLTGENAYTFGMGTNLQLCRRSDTDANIPYRVRTDKFEPAVNKVNNIAFGGQHTLLIVQ